MEQKRLCDYIDKEKTLRLKWFGKNEQKLEDYATRPNVRTVSNETKTKLEIIQQELLQQDRLPRKKTEDPIPAGYEGAEYNIMRPVDPNTTKLLYKDTLGVGRIKYLGQRVKLIPENRYYFPECTSFVYGWQMWDYSKDNPMVRRGKSNIIKSSFYRRRGVERNPDWYKECAKISSTNCGTI